jgi:hypothetical protein
VVALGLKLNRRTIAGRRFRTVRLIVQMELHAKRRLA